MFAYVYCMAGKRRSGLANDRRAYRYVRNLKPVQSLVTALEPVTIPVTVPEPTTYTVTYNGNTNTIGSVPTYGSLRYASGSTVTVLGNSNLEKIGFIFSGWNTLANGSGISYSPGNTLTINSNIILYAVWTVSNALPAPILLSGVGGNTEAYILFTQSGTVTNYEYSTDDGITFLAFDPPQIYSPVNITKLSSDGLTPLTNETTYTVKLRAVDSELSSNSVDVTPEITALESNGRIIYLDANNLNSYPGSGNSWTNLDSNGSYSATLYGSPTLTAEQDVNYFEFNPGEVTGQYSQINQNSAINPVQNVPFTIQMWVRINNLGSQGSLVSKVYGAPSYDGYALGYKTDSSSNNMLQLHENGSSAVNYFSSTSGALSNKWMLYTANIQFGNGGGRKNKLFVNGRQILNSTSNESGVPSPTQNLTFPRGFYGEGKCDIGQFYYYNTELTTAQIIQNFDATKHAYNI